MWCKKCKSHHHPVDSCDSKADKLLDKAKGVSYTMSMSKEIKKYLSMVGRKGGLKKSKRKTNACRKNGRLGGRPKRTVAEND